MKQLRRCAIFILCLTLILLPAAIAESLSASVNGSALNVSWSVNCGGAAVLTVYRNSWPVSIRNVDCADGGARVKLSAPAGKYSVRLKTASGCLTATAVTSKDPAPTAAPTRAPAATPTATAAPAPSATPRPTAAPTATPKPAQSAGNSQTDLASKVVAQVNAERAKYGLSTLRVSSELTRAACVRAQEIVRSFSHTRPDGTSWSTVSAAAHGENIAKGHRSVDAVMAAWMSSQGHRENILRARFDTIGVCAYNYNGTLYWVQLFG